MTGTKYGTNEETDRALRVIAEHSRGITFLIGDGVIPGNEGRGYVLRRLLRRTSIFARRLGLEHAFLSEMAEIVMKNMGAVYPEIAKRRDFILKVIALEEARFETTLNKGLELIENIMAAANEKKEISGADAFRLYDTFGFPVELTAEIAEPRGFKIDREGFEREMEKQREKARSAHKFENEEKELTSIKELHLTPSVFTGYGKLRQKSNILSIIVGKETNGTIGEGQEAGIILETTPFYGEMGGQVGDTGEIIGPSGRFEVANTIHGPGDIIIHRGKVIEGIMTAGEEVDASVDTMRRADIARNHTATHLLQYALRRVLGEHVQQRGSLVAPERLRFDFSHLTSLNEKEIFRHPAYNK